MLLIAKKTTLEVKQKYKNWYKYERAKLYRRNYDIHYIFLDMLYDQLKKYNRAEPIKIGKKIIDNDLLLIMKLLTNNKDCSF